MSSSRIVTIGAGPSYTSIYATIPAHYLKITPDSDRNIAAMNYKLPKDNFTAVFTTDASIGDSVEQIGSGLYTFLGTQAAFSASLQAATELIRVKFADDVSRDVVVFESENAL